MNAPLMLARKQKKKLESDLILVTPPHSRLCYKKKSFQFRTVAPSSDLLELEWRLLCVDPNKHLLLSLCLSLSSWSLYLGILRL